MKKTTRFTALVMALVLAAASQPAAAASKTVKTQQELTDALASGKYTKLTVKEYEATGLKIPEGNYTKVSLNIKSPDLKVENSATFKQIVISDASSFTEKASGNKIKSIDKQLKLIVSEGAEVNSLTFNKRGASITVSNGGTISKLKLVSKTNADIIQNNTLKKLYVYQPSTLNIVGTAASKTSLYIYDGAGGTGITSNVPVKCTLYDDVSVAAEAGAEGTSLIIKDPAIGVSYTNKTSKKSTVKEADGSKKSIAAGKEYTKAGSEPPVPTQVVPTAAPTPTTAPTPTPEPTATPTPEPTATPTPVPLSFTVVQVSTQEVRIEGNAAKADLKAADISLYYMNGTTKVTAGVPRVNKITAEEGKANITFYSSFIAGREYTVTIGDSTASFTAASDTLDDIASMDLLNTTVNIGENTKLDFRYYDANGVDLTPRVSGYINFTTYKNDNPGYLSVVDQAMQSGAVKKYQLYSGGQIYFSDEGTAQLVCTLVISRDQTTKTNKEVSCSPLVVGSLPEVKTIYYTVAKDDGVYMTTADEQKKTIEIGDTANCFELIIEYADGTKKTLSELGAEYTIESSDLKKVTVNSTQSRSGGKVLVPTGVGTVDLVIKRKTAVIGTCSIEVREARKAQYLSVLPSKQYLNTNQAVGDTLELVATVTDQYGDEMENPGLTITENTVSIQTTGTVAFGTFTNGKLVINGSSVTINGTGNEIRATVTSTSNTNLKAEVYFYVKNVAYDSALDVAGSMNYRKYAHIEGNTSIDTVLSVGTQKNEATNVYLEYLSQDGYVVKTTAGTPLSFAPGSYTNASNLNVASGTTGIYYTISKDNVVMPISYFQAEHVKLSADKISFIPFASQSKLMTGYYQIDFYQITAYESNSIVDPVGSATVSVVESQPQFTYQMIGSEIPLAVIGNWSAMATALIKMYWNGVQIASDTVQAMSYTQDAASQKYVLTGVNLKLQNSVYGEFNTFQNIGSEIFSYKQ